MEAHTPTLYLDTNKLKEAPYLARRKSEVDMAMGIMVERGITSYLLLFLCICSNYLLFEW